MAHWYRLEVVDVLTRLETDLEQGLSRAEVQRRLAEHGRRRRDRLGRRRRLCPPLNPCREG
jgi:hypothetical protein